MSRMSNQQIIEKATMTLASLQTGAKSLLKKNKKKNTYLRQLIF